MTKLVKLGLASILSAGALYAGTFNIDKTHSNVGFKIKHLMISNVYGKFTDFSGSFEYDEKTKKITNFNGVVKAASVDTEDMKRDGHLKSEDFFNVKKYSDIKFKVENIKDEKANGVLTIKGISKNVSFDFENNGTIIDPWGNTRMGLEISGKINRKDFGLTWNKALEAGGVVVGDTVKLNIELEGILAK